MKELFDEFLSIIFKCWSDDMFKVIDAKMGKLWFREGRNSLLELLKKIQKGASKWIESEWKWKYLYW